MFPNLRSLELSETTLDCFFPSWLAVRGRETYYLRSGSADGAILAWKIGSGKGDVSLFCFHLTIIPYFCSVTYIDVLHHSSVVLDRVAVAAYLLGTICLINM